MYGAAVLAAQLSRDAVGHGDDIQVVQESSEKLSWSELLGSRRQRRVLRKGKQGGSQRVALLTAIAL